VVPPIAPFTLPLHEIVRVAASLPFQTHPVPNPEEKDPVILPPLMLTTASLEAQDPSFPLIVEGFAAPPEIVNGREKDTLASNWHETEPGARPAYLGRLTLLADAGTEGVSTRASEATKSSAKNGPRLITAPPDASTCRLYDPRAPQPPP
jgi:hypothetical protein